MDGGIGTDYDDAGNRTRGTKIFQYIAQHDPRKHRALFRGQDSRQTLLGLA
jgi:hypothetical protein